MWNLLARPIKGGRRMKIRAQIGMVLNLDKCIGCHTCSVTCKNVWTNREGVEYAWFNNVETKPGIGYPKEWENQKKWNGGWAARPTARSSRRWAASGASWPRSSPIRDLPEIDDYYEPFNFDYAHLQTAPESQASPTARPRSTDHRRADGEDRMGAELGGDPRRRVREALEGRQFRGRRRRRSTASSRTPS